MKSLIKKLIPKFLLGWYHYVLAISANILYRFPSGKMIVIGVTGTAGKSTVVYLLSKILESQGDKVGYISTMAFKVAREEKMNDRKMTMLGRLQTQKFLRKMLKAGCKYAIIETTSQGIEQFRHIGINYDIVLLTNLFPEHIEAHGSFENYKKAKGKLFKKLKELKTKKIAGKTIKKTSIINLDDEHADYFLQFPADEKVGYGSRRSEVGDRISDFYKAENVQLKSEGVSFIIESTQFDLSLFGEFNVYNTLAAITVGLSQGINLENIKQALEKVKNIPGRIEQIDEGQNFKIVVDYAFTPEALEELYKIVNQWGVNKMIHVLGSAGGGRDAKPRPIKGNIAGENADYVIVTNEDPYDEDPIKIIDQVSQGVLAKGKVLDENLFKILDRKDAIQKAIDLAQENDLILITGKGSEQAIVIKNNKLIPWDDREVVRELLKI